MCRAVLGVVVGFVSMVVRRGFVYVEVCDGGCLFWLLLWRLFIMGVGVEFVCSEGCYGGCLFWRLWWWLFILAVVVDVVYSGGWGGVWGL